MHQEPFTPDIRLELPDMRWIDGLLANFDERLAIGEDPEPWWPIDEIKRNPDAYIAELLARRTRASTAQLVPATEYWIIDVDGFAGRLDIRHELNEHLRRFGGHIGYDIRPSRRCRGYGTRALQLGLVEARKLGLDRVLVTCDEHNTPSRKIIEANGGVLEDAIATEFRPTLTCRYWIALGDRS